MELETGGFLSARFKAPKIACGPCELRQQCLRHPDRSPQRQVAFFKGRASPGDAAAPSLIVTMKRKIDSLVGRMIYGKRIATIEHVFGNIQNKGMRRFTLRGTGKVNTQWRLFLLAHNMEKIAHFAPG